MLSLVVMGIIIETVAVIVRVKMYNNKGRPTTANDDEEKK